MVSRKGLKKVKLIEPRKMSQRKMPNKANREDNSKNEFREREMGVGEEYIPRHGKIEMLNKLILGNIAIMKNIETKERHA